MPVKEDACRSVYCAKIGLYNGWDGKPHISFCISSFDTVNGTVENCFGFFTGIKELYIKRYISQIVSVVYCNWYKSDFRFHKQ